MKRSIKIAMTLSMILSLATVVLAVGGETCETAVVITGLPFTDTGDTTAFVDDYDEECPYPGSTASDVVYSYSPAVTMNVEITLCTGISDYDTKLYIYEDVCPDNLFACNDDDCAGPAYPDAFQSRLYDIVLDAGSTYYIVVDGYSGGNGNYEILITALGIPTPTPTPPCAHTGDVTMDSIHTAEDAQIAFNIVMSLYTPIWDEWCAADCNGDSDVTAADAQSIFGAVLALDFCVDPIPTVTPTPTLTPTNTPVAVLDQVNEDFNTTIGSSAVGCYQSFRTGYAGQLARIDVWIDWLATENGTFRLYQGEGTTGIVLSEVPNIYTGTSMWFTIWLPTPVSVSADQLLSLNLEGNFFYTRMSNVNPYPDGRCCISGNDILFRTWMLP